MSPDNLIPSSLQLTRKLNPDISQRIKAARVDTGFENALQVLNGLHAGRNVLMRKRSTTRKIMIREAEDAVTPEIVAAVVLGCGGRVEGESGCGIEQYLQTHLNALLLHKE
jgi:hypothetical protein